MRKRRFREIMPLCALLPGAAQSACPGYRLTALCDPVARTDAQHRLRETLSSTGSDSLPGGGAKRLPGLQVNSPLRSRSPGKAFTPRPGKMSEEIFKSHPRAVAFIGITAFRRR
ncbi:hypothetical protein FML14_05245 [Klebsiella oxytoca]|nr:hypothetical protein [Klebsiella oxytoca]